MPAAKKTTGAKKATAEKPPAKTTAAKPAKKSAPESPVEETRRRPFDIVLFGATGFTGRLTADYLAGNAPQSLRWALAGRDVTRLEQIRDELISLNPQAKDIELVYADVRNVGTIEELAASTRVVITTVGPYTNYGEPLVAACARNGTDYLDLTGEPNFVDEMYVKYHDEAVKSGARIVHCCGFDSIPHDLGAYFTVQQLPEGVPLTVHGYVSAMGGFSGGTARSAMAAGLRGWRYPALAVRRRLLEGRPRDRKASISLARLGPRPSLGGVVAPLPTIDPMIVLRSARAIDRYGPDFSYGHHVLLTSVKGAVSVAARTAADVLSRPTTSGRGPSEEARSKSWFKVLFEGSGGGQKVVTEVAGGDPGYGETAKMLAEAALCLALDDLPPSAGQLTPVQAMGDALIERLQKAGITFRVVSRS